MEAGRRRGQDARPPAALPIPSPDDLEARSGTTRDTEWVGSKTQMRAPGDEGDPDLLTHALTTLSTTPDWVRGPTIQED
jgi:hypothetical protein